METSLNEFKMLCGMLRKKIILKGGVIEESHLKLLYATLGDKTIEWIYLGPDIVFKVDYKGDQKPIEEVYSPTITGWRTPTGRILDTQNLGRLWLSKLDILSECGLD